MAIGPVAGVIQIDPALVRAAQAAQAAPDTSEDGFAATILQQETAVKGAGGGHNGHKAALDAIARVAAGVDAKPKERVKSLAERQADTERMKRERDARSERDLADDQTDRRKQPYEKNPLLALF